MRIRHALVLLVLAACSGGSSSPTAPVTMTDGRWAGDNACLDLHQSATSNFVVGCGHGKIPPFTLRSDGTFDVEGTYRIELGPASPDPAPPAHYSGAVHSGRITLTVTPSVSSLPQATYHLEYNPNANCGPPCV